MDGGPETGELVGMAAAAAHAAAVLKSPNPKLEDLETPIKFIWLLDADMQKKTQDAKTQAVTTAMATLGAAAKSRSTGKRGSEAASASSAAKMQKVQGVRA